MTKKNRIIREKLSSLIIIFHIILLLGNFNIEAQIKKPIGIKPGPPVKKKTEINSQNDNVKQATFDVTGLEKSDFFKYIHDGRFNRIENDMRFKMTVEGYVTSFSSRCQSALSKNRIEITRYVSTYRNETTFIPWGRTIVPITSRRLESSGEVGTGIYAEPEFADVYSRLTVGYLLDFMKKVQRPTLTDGVSALMQSTADAIDISVQTYSDMNKLLINNGCDSSVTKRFSENLLRLAKGQQSVQAANGEKSYFVRECESNLPKLFPQKSSDACPCIEREFNAALPASSFYSLEDDFDAANFNDFLFISVSRAGLQKKVSNCVGKQ